MSDVDRIINIATETLERARGRHRSVKAKVRAQRRAHAWRKLGRIMMAIGGIAVAAGLIGVFISPLGFAGVMLTLGLICLSVFLLATYPRFPQPRVEELTAGDIGTLAGRTELWLETQRPALPAPARTLVDGIGVQLEMLAPQLQTLNPADPAALAVKRLVGEELPQLIEGYRKVPEPLRREAQGMGTPDEQLIGGLSLIEREIGTMSRQLAAGQLDQLATKQRYLEIKYQGDTGT